MCALRGATCEPGGAIRQHERISRSQGAPSVAPSSQFAILVHKLLRCSKSPSSGMMVATGRRQW
jgi:hypothetical protein